MYTPTDRSAGMDVNFETLPLLLPYQQAVILDPAKFIVIEKSRRIGISFALALKAVETASRAKNPQNVYYVSYNFAAAKEWLERDCGYWIDFFKDTLGGLQADDYILDSEQREPITVSRISFASGCKITVLPSKPRVLRGVKGVVIIDEAAYVENFKEMLVAANAVKLWGGQVIVSSTHTTVDSAFNLLVKDLKAGFVAGTLHSIDIHTAVSQGICKYVARESGQYYDAEYELGWLKDVFETFRDNIGPELLLEPSSGSGGYFDINVVMNAMDDDYPVIRFTAHATFMELTPTNQQEEVRNWLNQILWPWVKQWTNRSDVLTSIGQDFGRNRHLSVIAPICQIAKQKALICPFLLELANVPHECQKTILNYLIERMPRTKSIWLDRTGNGSFLAEAIQLQWGNKLHVEGVSFSQQTYITHMPALRAAIEDGRLILPFDLELQDDFRGIQFMDGVPRPPKKNTGNRHSDGVVALMLGFGAAGVTHPGLTKKKRVLASVSYSPFV